MIPDPGRTRDIPPSSAQGGSFLLVEEYFDREDGRFVEALRQESSSERLAGFVDRWKRDPRPWARAQITSYLEQPWDRPGHQPVIKRLFKHAEDERNDELLAVFFVALDRLVRRERRRRVQYDWRTREMWAEETLAPPKNVIPLNRDLRSSGRNPRTGEAIQLLRPLPRDGRLFSYRTRYYLRRRVWRYFRRMGRARPAEYPPAIARALIRYADDDLIRGEHILDCRGLLHAGFRHHDALEFGPSKIRLKPGRQLSELSPAPQYLELWRKPESCAVLLDLLTRARSRFVRLWTIELLQREHADRLKELPPEHLLTLIDHAEPDVSQFGAERLERASGLERLPLATWLKLLETRNLTALESIGRAMQRHVAGERLSLAECVRLASSAPVSVARLGFEFLKSKPIATAADRETICGLSSARCEAAAGSLATWALGHVGRTDVYDRDQVLRFFDSLSQAVRTAAWIWLTSPPLLQRGGPEGGARSPPDSTEPARQEPRPADTRPSGTCPAAFDSVFWSRLVETPYDDVRLNLIEALDRLAGLPKPVVDDLTPVWASVLLGVHRGGRQKLRATRQIAAAIAERPARADDLLPVLAVALRSIRGPEMRAALAALVGLVDERSELTAALQRHVPELIIHER